MNDVFPVPLAAFASPDEKDQFLGSTRLLARSSARARPGREGRDRRMAVVFHRMIMPDGYSVDLDQFKVSTKLLKPDSKTR
jgi:hypothetical protein